MARPRRPTVTFSSVPELPEDEVLAQLIFGVDLDSITPFQAVQLASGVATLAGRGGGLIDSLRGDAGLADLDITTDDAGNAALRLGQYISENVYTDVIVSTEDDRGHDQPRPVARPHGAGGRVERRRDHASGSSSRGTTEPRGGRRRRSLA